MEQKKCAFCGKMYEPQSRHSDYCSDECRKKARSKKNSEQNKSPRIKEKPKYTTMCSLTNDAIKARNMGLSYGQYKAKYQ